METNDIKSSNSFSSSIAEANFKNNEETNISLNISTSKVSNLTKKKDDENKFEPVIFNLDQSLSTSEENTSNSSTSSDFKNSDDLNSSLNPIDTKIDDIETEASNLLESNNNKTGEHLNETNALNRYENELEKEITMNSSNYLINESDNKLNSRSSPYHSSLSINSINNTTYKNDKRNSNSSTELNPTNDSSNRSLSVPNDASNNLAQSTEEIDKSSFASANNSFTNDDSLQLSNKKLSPNNSSSGNKLDKTKKPWYSAFTNTYKQKNADFKKLFKLKPEEHLLVDYSCALQREILAHGRLYISLNYVCFRANIIGWETTLIIKLKDIRHIIKDKTAKIIPNAITIVLDNERYFFTSFAARDKTYTTLLRVWQIALADASMSPDEINNILKTSYGEDLGYNSDDADYEYYSKLKSKEQTLLTPDFKFYKHPIASSTIEFNTTNSEANFATRDITVKNLSNISSSDSSSSSPLISKDNYLPTYLSTNNSETPSRANLGHRQSSSFDTSLIDTNERPRSMVVSKKTPTSTSTSSAAMTAAVPIITKSPTSVSESLNAKTSDIETNNRLTDDENNNYSTVTNNNQMLSDTSKLTDSINPSSSILITSSPMQNNEPSSDISSSSESEDSEEDLDYIVKCSCGDHQGKEMLNQVFNLSVNYLWESLFGHTEFCRKYWESRKFYNFKIPEWKPVSTYVMRQLDYSVDLGPIGRAKNTEDQKIIEYRPNVCIVIESESATHGVPYSDCFTVRNRFCLTRVTSNSTRLCITAFINYLQKPNFIAKSFIERNCMGALKDSYNYLANLIDREYVNCDKFCHEFKSSTQLKNCLLTISSKNSTHDKNASSDGSFTLSYVNNQIIREKTIPKIVQPNALPVHISAVTNTTSTTLLNQKNVINGKHIYSTSNTTSLSQTNISNKNSSNETNENINTNNNNNISTSSTTSRPVSTSSKYSTGNTIRKRISRNSQSNDFQNGINETTNETHKTNQKTQPQLVPIQKFSFYRWEINVDTLVRLFIIAMICLMIINGMLYFKLRRIETLADGLRNDPNVLAKISNQQMMQKQYENKLNENSLLNDLHGWRDVISNTLNVIEKMETSLKEWDKSLEKRQTEKDLNSIVKEFTETNKKDV